jgi:hypothetical protein
MANLMKVIGLLLIFAAEQSISAPPWFNSFEFFNY